MGRTLLFGLSIVILSAGRLSAANIDIPLEAIEAAQIQFDGAEIEAWDLHVLPWTDQVLYWAHLYYPDNAVWMDGCLDRDLQVVDCMELLSVERDARFEAVGVMSDALARKVGTMDAEESIAASLFVRVDQTGWPELDREHLSSLPREQADKAFDEYVEARMLALDEAKRPVLEDLRSDGIEVTYSSTLSPVVFAKMKREDIFKRAWDGERISRLAYDNGKLGLTAIVGSESAGLNTYWQESYFGEGRTIADVEPGEIYFDNPYILSEWNARINKAHNPADEDSLFSERHATFVAGVVGSNYLFFMAGAPLATVISANWSGNGFAAADVAAAQDWAVTSPRSAKVLNNSWGCGLPNQWDCDDNLFFHMDYISNNYFVTMTKAAGNDAQKGHQVSCEPYSAICVGAYNDNNTTPYTNPPFPPSYHVWDDLWSTFSSYVDASWSGDRELPHVTAPGEGMSSTREDDEDLVNWKCTQQEMDAGDPSWCVPDPDDWPPPTPTPEEFSRGTSISTPVVSGFSALLMEQGGSTYGLWVFPEQLRAILFASATNDTDCIQFGYSPGNCPSSYMRRSEYDGMGGINASDAFTILDSGTTWRAYISKSTVPGTILYTVSSNISSGMKVRMALAWLEDVEWIRDHSNLLKNDLQLYAYSPSGALVASSLTSRDNTEIVEFTTTTTGVYTFKVINQAWRNPANNLWIGLALSTFSSSYAVHPR